MNTLATVADLLKSWVVVITGLILIFFLIYFGARLITTAYFNSKRDFMSWNLNDKIEEEPQTDVLIEDERRKNSV